MPSPHSGVRTGGCSTPIRRRTRSPEIDRITVAGIRVTPRTARAYFGFQALAGALWWIGVFTTDAVRLATLGDLPAGVIAIGDIPLFVLASALVAWGIRLAARIAVPWTVLVAAGMAVYSTATTLAGWGALLMTLSAMGSVAAGIVIVCGRAPVEWIVRGPFAFRTARNEGRARLAARTVRQMLLFWVLFLGVLPVGIAAVEARWMLRMDVPVPVRVAGGLLFIAASALGIRSAVSVLVVGEGTPLPAHMARRLVITGPYRYVRNPMAVAGIAQGVAVGLALGSWLVVAYALCGSLIWNTLVRPQEEADLESRFGAEFDEYRRRVPCWVPRLTRRA
ncbi:MAG: isoprenylcysteine carboxylmethyltransferase family protein [Microbacterium sp.]|uniref:methyltransferase family protein n=1 Tax=Microbacterium sp. TaxID=51671 RepID=UPI001D5CB6A4|nr:isoprenylcysteine carboxylmethyltransferase family protein [Microbacterium sp.]MBW8763876.1 isoprenylcysteine carboxylmethyltransferase family protein [Microbacterium sp.]